MVLYIVHLLQGGFSTGQFGCKLSAAIIFLSYGISLLSLCGMTINRYLIVMRNYYLTAKTCFLVIVTFWIGMTVVIATFFGLAGGYLALQSGNTYCFIPFDAVGMDPKVMTAAALTLLMIILPIVSMGFAYYRIIDYYLKANRKNNADLMEMAGLSENEKRLILKAAALTGGYMLCFSIYLIKVH